MRINAVAHVTHRAADILIVSLGSFTWLVYVCTYCVSSIATLNQNISDLDYSTLYLGDAQITTGL